MNILIDNAFEEIKNELRKLSKDAKKANTLRFDEKSTKEEIVELTNNMWCSMPNEGISKIEMLLKGIRENLDIAQRASRC